MRKGKNKEKARVERVQGYLSFIREKSQKAESKGVDSV